MRISKFFRFTIEGDNLDVNVVKEKINLDAEIFYKNIPIKKYYNGKEVIINQKTNRWVYSNCQIDSVSPEKFLMINLLTLKRQIINFNCFLCNYKCSIELVLYAEDKTDICLSSKHIELLNEIGVPFHISFC